MAPLKNNNIPNCLVAKWTFKDFPYISCSYPPKKQNTEKNKSHQCFQTTVEADFVLHSRGFV